MATPNTPADADTHAAVTRRVYEYAYGIDTRDWGLYRSIFADRLTMDFSSYNGRPGAEVTGDDWVAGVQPLFTGLDATQHSMSNPLVDVTGRDADGLADRARCRMYMQAAHFLDGHEFTIGGYYDDLLHRVDERWRIEAVTLVVWWRRGDESIMSLAAEIGAAQLAAISPSAAGSSPPTQRGG